jgi:hypothetical protein
MITEVEADHRTATRAGISLSRLASARGQLALPLISLLIEEFEDHAVESVTASAQAATKRHSRVRS